MSKKARTIEELNKWQDIGLLCSQGGNAVNDIAREHVQATLEVAKQIAQLNELLVELVPSKLGRGMR